MGTGNALYKECEKLVYCSLHESIAGGRGSFILRSTTGKPEGPYENIEGNEDKAIFPNIDGSLFEDTDGTVYFVGHNHYIARMKPDMSGLAEEIKTLKEVNTLRSRMLKEHSSLNMMENIIWYKLSGHTAR